MADAAPAWRSDLYGLLLHPVEPRALLLPGRAGWSLPAVHLDERIWFEDVRGFTRAVQETLALRVTVLHRPVSHIDREARRQEAVCVLESHEPMTRPPAGARWVGRADLERLPLAQEAHRCAIDACLQEIESGTIPELRPPWARRDWFAAASAWTRDQLEARGCRLTDAVEQVRTWGISCILRAPTGAGDVYFKEASAGPLFANEPDVVNRLAGCFPENVPAPLAVDRERRWLLLPNVGARLRGHPNHSLLEDTLRTFARLQRRTVNRTAHFIEAGCLDRRLERLATQIDPLLEDEGALARLARAEIDRLRALSQSLKAMCAALAAYRVPQTLVHGDFHPGNVAVRDGRLWFFDWTDACIAHLFFDPVTFLEFDDDQYEGDRHTRLREAYLSVWADDEPYERLLEAWRLAKILGALHQAVSYQHIVRTLEPAARPDLDWTHMFLRTILAAYETEGPPR